MADPISKTPEQLAQQVEPQPQQQPSRRNFAEWVVFGTIAVVVGGLFALREYFHSRATPGVVIAGARDVPVGGSAIFQFPTPTDPCVLIRTSADAYVAYSRICTHGGCPVSYQTGIGVLACPCHGGVFSIADGSVLQGPPPRPLPRIQVERRGNDLVATGVSRT
jgi:nitrite reductase/ring-hydroxylating ferredoxin subunit